MKPEICELEFITPCFCAGATQSTAELRVSAIRGQLRWWFRVLGGSPAEENLVFGGGQEPARGSNLMVRVVEPPAGGETNWVTLPLSMGHGGYLWYFIKAASPPRWQASGAIPPGSRCKIAFSFRRALTPSLRSRWEETKESFLRFGGLGYRVTRCAGAIHCAGFNGSLDDYRQAAQRLLKTKGFDVQFPEGSYPTWRALIEAAELLLKNQLRAANKAKSGSSPLGADNPRQTSAVYLRPLKTGPREYRLMVFEAPHSRVLGKPSLRSTPLLRAVSLSFTTAAAAGVGAPRRR